MKKSVDSSNISKPIESAPISSTSENRFENLDPHILASFSYLLPPFTGIAFYIIGGKLNKFVKYHSLQSIVFGFFVAIYFELVSIIGGTSFGEVTLTILNLMLTFTWIVLMIKAYQKEEFELPVVGRMIKTAL